MAKRKAKSTRNKATADITSEVPQSKRQRNQSTDNITDASSSPAIDDLPLTDTFGELHTTNMDISNDIDASDDEDSIDWETVELPKWTPLTATTSQQQEQQMDVHGDVDQDHVEPHEQFKDVHVVFEAPRAVLKKSKWEMAYQRQLRDWMHNSHVVLLVGHFLIRNDWCSREDVKSVCLSVIPDYISSQYKRKDESDHQFYTTIKWLMAWWHEHFKVTGPGMVTRSLETFASIPLLDPDENLIQELETHLQRLGIQDSEKIGNPTAFVNYLTEKQGSRDLCAQLFITLLRTLGFETRLVCSLQPIPFRIPATGSDKASSSRPSSPTISTTDPVDNTTKASTQKSSTKRNKSSSNTKTDSNQYQSSKAKPPTVWCEVWNHHQKQWICVDPIRQLYNKPHQMEPGVSNRQNILSFVLAFEDRLEGERLKKRHRIKRVVDVTRRYTTHLPKALALRERELTKRERQGGWQLWSDPFLYGLQPPALVKQHQQQHEGSSSSPSSLRYDMEQKELEQKQHDQRMPTSIQGLKNHPLYVLERHLKKFEVLHHPSMDSSRMVVGHIRGENIYPRSCVQQIHTRETWMKQGRVVMENQVPVKRVLARAVTLEKKRLQEEAKMQGDPLQTDCFGYWQTAPYKAPPVVDGKITKNSYGRVDLFTTDMLPEGAAHIEKDGMGKIARQLGIDYAEAVVDFEFVRGRSVPVVNGVIVAEENELMLLEAWREHEHHKANKAMAKQEKEAYSRWRKLIQGAMIDARIDTTYGTLQQHSLLGVTNDSDERVASSSGAKNHGFANSTAWDRYMKKRHLKENTLNDDGDVDGDDSGGFILEDDQDDGDDDENDDDYGGGFLLDDE